MLQDWVAQLGVDKRGGEDGQLRAIIRGAGAEFTLNLANHPVFGDWTAGTFTMTARENPGDPAANITYTPTVGAVANGLTPVKFTAPVSQQLLPTIDAAVPVRYLPYMIFYQLTGQDPELVMGGLQPVQEIA